MYKYEIDNDGCTAEIMIFDPEGAWICSVPTVHQAETLLYHLNKMEDSLMKHLMEG